MTMRATRRSCAALLLLLAGAGCSGELVGGGQREVDVVATGGGGPDPAPSRSVEGADAGAAQSAAIGGTVSVAARVSLVRAGVPVRVGTGSATVAAAGGDTARVVRGRVAEGRYPAARVVFTRVTADVTGTLGGVDLTGRVEVAIPPGDSVVVELPVELGAPRSPARLVVELNAAAWLAAADPATRTVPAAAFAGAVRLRGE